MVLDVDVAFVDFGVWPMFPGVDVGQLDRRVRCISGYDTLTSCFYVGIHMVAANSKLRILTSLYRTYQCHCPSIFKCSLAALLRFLNNVFWLFLRLVGDMFCLLVDLLGDVLRKLIHCSRIRLASCSLELQLLLHELFLALY